LYLSSIILADPKEIMVVENVTFDDLKAVEGNPFEKSFSGNFYRETFQKLLLHFESKGIL
jgi:hypothetical protein